MLHGETLVRTRYCERVVAPLRERLSWASKLGHKVHVVRSYEEFIQIVNGCIDNP